MTSWRMCGGAFEDYLGLIAKLVQTGSLADYNTTFETMRNRIPNIQESTFLPIYIVGLQRPVRSQVKHNHTRSVAAAMALAIEFDGSNDRSIPQQDPNAATGHLGTKRGHLQRRLNRNNALKGDQTCLCPGPRLFQATCNPSNGGRTGRSNTSGFMCVL